MLFTYVKSIYIGRIQTIDSVLKMISLNCSFLNQATLFQTFFYTKLNGVYPKNQKLWIQF